MAVTPYDQLQTNEAECVIDGVSDPAVRSGLPVIVSGEIAG